MLETVQMLEQHFQGKTVLVTGHTGFKGSWLSEWLLLLGAKVVGIGLEPEGEPPLFTQLGLEDRFDHHILDIREADAVAAFVAGIQPDVVIHLAAQSLVRYSYDHPLETFHTNTLGTAHMLSALRGIRKPCSAVFVTSDKCYENVEQSEPYSESDRMGGYDPYSASKAAAEQVISCFRRSYFNPETYGTTHSMALASARAGNVIGGGDWAADRIVPDCMRTLSLGKPVPVRNPAATRPWQHVLEPLGGYLSLACHLMDIDRPEARTSMCSGFNFGPDPQRNYSVRELVEKILTCWPGRWVDESGQQGPHEAGLLNLKIEKAARLLNWVPVWGFDASVEQTVSWYRSVLDDPSSAHRVTQSQIERYMEESGNVL